MKTPLEIEEKNTSTEADFLRRQYFDKNDSRLMKIQEKNESMLTPFLLSIPVIIMLIILIYSL